MSGGPRGGRVQPIRGKRNGKRKDKLHRLASNHARGYARELASRAQTAEAQVQLEIAQRNLKEALCSSDTLRTWEDRKLNSDLYRSLVLNCEQLHQYEQMKRYLNDWTREHPDDPMARIENDRLYAKFRLA